MGLDFSMTDDQKKIARIAGIVVAVVVLLPLTAWGIYRTFSSPYDLATLDKLDREGRPPTAEELSKIAPMLNHPNKDVRTRVNNYFSNAQPADVTVVGQNASQYDPNVQRQVEGHWVRAAPQSAVPALAAQVKTSKDPNRRADLYLQIIGTGEPAALVPAAEALEDKSETVVSLACDAIGANPKKVNSRELLSKLDKLANDPAQSQRIQFHAKRAANALRGISAPVYYPGSEPNSKGGAETP
jgi:hypothetical protein